MNINYIKIGPQGVHRVLREYDGSYTYLEEIKPEVKEWLSDRGFHDDMHMLLSNGMVGWHIPFKRGTDDLLALEFKLTWG